MGSSLFGGSGYGNNNMTSDPMVHEEVALRLDLEATPTPDDLGDNKGKHSCVTFISLQELELHPKYYITV